MTTPDTNNPASDAAKVSPPKADAVARKSGSSLGVPALLILVILLFVGGGYWAWLNVNALQKTQDQLQQRATQQTRTLDTLKAQQQQTTTKTDLQQTLAGFDQRLANQSNRVRALESTNRDDWLLAEAEYLLRLANQRMLMERGTEGALALLENADTILRDLDNDDLFAVRQQLARDITSLKLAPSLDRSGLYLQLAALAESIEKLPDLPSDMTIDEQPVPVADTMLAETETQDPSTWQQLQNHFWSAMSVVGKHIRIRHHDQPIVPILPPKSSAYVRQNIRLILERAQLAMLRENQSIYQHSLNEAGVLLQRYFGAQDQARVLTQELENLAQREISTELPSIRSSLTALRDYTDQLHKLAPQGQGSNP